MEDKGQDVLQSLSSAMINTLLHDLGLDKYLKNPQCDRMADVYENAVNGWNSGEEHFKETPRSKLQIVVDD